MRVIICDNYDGISEKAAKIVASQVIINPSCVLGLATGSTPVGTYDKLGEMCDKGEIDFSEVKSFNLDEYYPLDSESDQSYHYFMKEHFFSKINIDPENTHLLDGMAQNPQEECKRYEKEIAKNGGIDLQILGIGQNGHIGFNEPDFNLDSATHLTNLTENTIKANSRFFENEDQVPRQALTMGMGTILQSKKIIILASGTQKHRVITELLNNDINTSVPATMLKVHPDVTLICDKEAYSSTRIGVDIGGTDIKFGVVNDRHEILYRDIIPTAKCGSADIIIENISKKCMEIMEKFPVNSVGVGTPGLIRSGRVFAANLSFDDLPLSDILSEKLGLPVEVSNDANCAALGEAVAGAGKDVDNLIMVTLGTGIGGGIIIGNRIYQGNGCAGEIGHLCIEHGGKACKCSLTGCWEQYASATALVAQMSEAAKDNPNSILGKLYAENDGILNGKLAFEAINQNCPVAKKVYDTYLSYLTDGINSLANIFDPDMIVISGGLSNAGDALIRPLQERFAYDIPIKAAQCRNDAGVLGAAML